MGRAVHWRPPHMAATRGRGEKNPAQWAGSLSCVASEKSVFGNERWRRQQIESVAEPSLHLVFPQMDIVVYECLSKRGAGGHNGVRQRIVEATEVRVAIFGKYPPIVGDRILNTAASRPTCAGVREKEVGNREGNVCRRQSVKKQI